MNGKVKLTFSLWICAVLLLLWGCKEWEYAHERSKQLWPSEEGFPDREIVFLIPHESENDIFGFIRPDGSGLITRTVAPGYFANLPTWSPDGAYIAFRAEDLGSIGYFGGGEPRVVSAAGKTAGWCPDWDGEWGIGIGRVWVTSEGRLLFTQYNLEKPDRVVLADYESCAILATLYEASTEGVLKEEVDGAALSSQGDLAVSRVFRDDDGRRLAADVFVIDPETNQEHVVGHGLAPAWSPDGEWLSYTGSDGIYIVRKDGTEARSVIQVAASWRQPEIIGLWGDEMSVSAWSPDGQWLVYDRLDSDTSIIVKANVETGEEIELLRWGAYPNWRWDLDGTNE